MSIKFMAKVYELAVDTDTREILLALADHADDEGYSVFPSIARVAWKIGDGKLNKDGEYKNTRTVQRRIKYLQSIGALVELRRPGFHRATEYGLDLSVFPKKAEFKPKGDNLSPKGDKIEAKGDSVVSPESSLNVNETSIRTKAAVEEFNAMPGASDENPSEKAKASVAKTLSSPRLGKGAGVSDAKLGKEYETTELAAMVASIQAQTTIPVEAFLDRGTSFAFTYTRAVEPLMQDIKKGVFSRSDIENAVKHLMNGDGEKYKKLSFSPSTIVGHIAEMVAKMKSGEIAPEQKVIRNADGSYYL